MLEMFALALVCVISFLIPLAILGVLVWNNKESRKQIFVFFLSGIILYGVMHWGIKEHGLAWLFNNTELLAYMHEHYISYLLMVAIAGSVLTIIPIAFMFTVIWKRTITCREGLALGLGYSMSESAWLIGIQSVNSLIELLKNEESTITVSSIDLFLSAYERILISVIEIVLVIVVAYFIRQKMTGKGCVIAVMVHALITFLPGFFLAFTMKEYYEIYDRPVALVLVYVVLTVSAITSIVVLNSLKYQLND